MDKYVLIGKRAVPYKGDTLEWSKKAFEADRKVAYDEIDGYRISTVFLGLDHSFGSGPPKLFETMIFKGKDWGEIYMDRCSTWKQAEEMHKKAVELVKSGKIETGCY